MSLLIAWDRSQPKGWGVQWEFHYTLPNSIYHLSTQIKTNLCRCICHHNAKHARLAQFSPWMNTETYITMKVSKVSDSGKFHFIDIWESLYPRSTVRSLLCIISCALCKAGWKLFFWCTPLHMMHSANNCGPLNISLWTGTNQRSTEKKQHHIIGPDSF